MALCIKENLEIELIDYYSPGYSLLFNDTEPRSEKEEAETAAMLFECGLITRNEGRIRVGHDVLPRGDIFATEDQAEKGLTKTVDEAKQIAIKDSN
jgi:hypothetical protein